VAQAVEILPSKHEPEFSPLPPTHKQKMEGRRIRYGVLLKYSYYHPTRWLLKEKKQF
jgi:hypothetical protein